MPKENFTILRMYWHKSGVCGCISRGLRPLQFVFAIVVAALYGLDLGHATKTNNTAPAAWIYAELVVTLSAITCTGYFFVPLIHAAWSTWDGILFVFWLAQTGVFGNMYISNMIDEQYKQATLSIPRMRAAVWIDLINMLLWLMTFILGINCGCRTRRSTRQGDELVNNNEHLMRSDDEECAPPEYKEDPKEDMTASCAAVEKKYYQCEQ
ncbi:hypothetical protein N7490_011340 [Penicillium lividum]|nr:hypothetical protein N7490_011340 [Penicillium lividum]